MTGGITVAKNIVYPTAVLTATMGTMSARPCPPFSAAKAGTEAQHEAQQAAPCQSAAAASAAPAADAEPPVTNGMMYQVLAEVRDALRGVAAARPGT